MANSLIGPRDATRLPLDMPTPYRSPRMTPVKDSKVMRRDCLARFFRACGLVALATAAVLPMSRAGADEPARNLAGRDLRALDGQKLTLKAPQGGATVLVFYSTE